MNLELSKIILKKIEFLQSITLIIIVFLLARFISLTFISVVLLLALWAFAIALNQVKKPSILTGNILAILTVSGLFIDIGFSDSVNLFVAMLLLSIVLKQLISTSILHFKTICLIQLFLISSVYLYQQSLYASILTFLFFIVNVATLNLIIRPSANLNYALKLSTKTLLLSLPMAFLFFLLLPKLPSFWSLPGPGVAKTGLNESIDPFSISKLSNSSELVFRAKFLKQTPKAPFYWRSMVHEEFTEQTWKITQQAKVSKDSFVSNNNSKYNYEIIAEKSGLHWLYALDYARSNTQFVDNKYAGLLARQKNLSQTFKYSVSSFDLRNIAKLSSYERYTNLSLIPNSNTKTILVAKAIKDKSLSDEMYFKNLYQYFINEKFIYTLEPPALYGSNKLDQFLLETKKGFCGHYASLAAFMFRSVGIPARVVSGYLGGELLKDEDYLSVFQYDAHAWTEVWLENKGWTRFDATSVVSPDRLYGSLSQSKANKEEFLRNLDFSLLSLQNLPMLNWVRRNLDAIDFMWTNWILGFNTQEQQGLLKRIFGSDQTLKIAFSIVTLLSAFLFSIYLYTVWKKKPLFTQPLAREYNNIKNWGEKNKVPLEPGVTPQTYLTLLNNHFTDKSKYLNQFLKLYIDTRYKDISLSKSKQNQAKKLVKLITKN
ncbi:hypothetical protein CJF42_18310 [Pseudoalteromonas sp. NBT06-2]|uniref:transglutaminase family protein n=1 Tax=Pseudoalteromonas sp. NBT06-2 TaxID=2025950 RepID=UPI000BA4F97D|nr:DUF3488 and transglutaminase-like domain-containing protein [Pseudoalteromonas sp. NBT06-2]PAJ72979.1 hypothetical protein CJF42_18310 [Pseudoalteromonas sp. NBT06-2]